MDESSNTKDGWPVPILSVAVRATVLAAMVCCGGSMGCQTSEKPNIVLITVDTLRADRLSPYGYDAIETPAIARLAREGVVFEKAIADTSWTLPSLSSVMTGSYPSEHKVRTWRDRLLDEHVTLAEILKEDGYRTAGIVGSYPLDRYFGLHQGFEHYDDEMTVALYERDGTDESDASEVRDRPVNDSQRARAVWQMNREKHNAYRTDNEVADAAIKWLEGAPDTPYFLWVHFFGPHEKGKRDNLDAAAQKALVDAQVARYDPDVVEMDRQVGRFLEALRADPRFEKTAVFFHSDHGQALREHGFFGHGLELYETTVHIPLIVRLPQGRQSGVRVRRLVRNLDIFPTVLHLAGVAVPATDGRDLFAEPAAAGNNHAYMETHHPIALTAADQVVGDRTRKVGRILRGIRTDETKLVTHLPALAPGEDMTQPLPDEFIAARTGSYLFDLAKDPDEHRNLASLRPRQIEKLRNLLANYDDGTGGDGSGNELDEAAKERLRSLGYQP